MLLRNIDMQIYVEMNVNRILLWVHNKTLWPKFDHGDVNL